MISTLSFHRVEKVTLGDTTYLKDVDTYVRRLYIKQGSETIELVLFSDSQGGLIMDNPLDLLNQAEEVA